MDSLFKFYIIAPEFFKDSFLETFICDDTCRWILEPEELFVMLRDCSLDIFPWISNDSWEIFYLNTNDILD